MKLWDRYYPPHFTDDNIEAREHEIGATTLGCNPSCPLLNSVFMYHNPSLDFLSYSLSQKKGVFSLFLFKDTGGTGWTRGSRGRSPGTACTVHTCGRGLHVGGCVHLCLLNEALGWKMVTKEEERRGQKDSLVTLKPPVHVSVSVSFSQVEFFFPK